MKQIIKCIFTVFLLLLCSKNILSQQKNIFKHYSLEQGLSQSFVRCILQDHKGFIWAGTQDGLNKYDGYKFTFYQTDLDNPNSISNVNVNCLFEDNRDCLWIGTLHGLNKLDLKTEIFTRYFYNIKNPNSISNDIILAITSDIDGNIWIGTENGLNKLDPKTNKIVRYCNIPGKNSISNNQIIALCNDNSGNIWIGTKNGLNKLNVSTDKISNYFNIPGNNSSVSNNAISSIVNKNKKELLIGTEYGYNRYDKKTDQFTQFVKGIEYKITSLCVDDHNTLWIGTEGGGLYKQENAKNDLLNFRHLKFDNTTLSNDNVLTLITDKSGNLWVGTEGGGINKINLHPPSFRHMMTQSNVWSIYEDSEKTIWVGTKVNGLTKLNPQTGDTKVFKNEIKDKNSISGNDARVIKEDKSGNLWIGTYNGLNKFNKKTEKFTRFTHDPTDSNSLSHNKVRALRFDKNGNLWIGTRGGGVNFLDTKTEKFKHYKNNPSDSNSLSHNDVYSITLEKDSLVWIGTYGGGLNKLNINTKKFIVFRKEQVNGITDDEVLYIYVDTADVWACTAGGINKLTLENNHYKIKQYTTKSGLLNNVAYSILPDGKGNFWVSSNRGLSRISEKGSGLNVRNYDMGDGLQDNEFNAASCFQNSDGEIFFGGINGFNVFNTDSIKDNSIRPTLIFTRFQIFNQNAEVWNPKLNPSIKVSSNEIIKYKGSYYLPENICEIEEIIMTYKESVFSIDFAGLHYAIPEKNQYAYIMDGFENEWNYSGTRHSVTYTSLPPGEYTFKIKAANCDGIWEDTPKALKITITPPFWATWWFRITAFLCLVVAVIAYIKIRENKLQKDKLLLEQVIRERTFEVTQQSEELSAQRDMLQDINSELEQLSIVASEIDNSVTIMNVEGKIEWVNKCFSKFWGYTLEELKKIKGDNLFEVADNPEIKELHKKCLLEKKSVVYNCFSLNKKGEKVWAQTTLTPILDEKGNIKKLIAIDSDISKIKDAEFQILEKNIELEKLSIVARETNNAITIMDSGGNIEWVNDGFTQVYGCGLEEYKAKYGSNILESCTNPYILESIMKCIVEKLHVVYESIHTPSIDKIIWIQTTLSPALDEDGNIIKLVAIDTNITDLKAAEAEILEKNTELEKLSIVASKTNNAIMILDAKGNIEWINDGFTRIYGYKLEQLNGKNILTLSPNQQLEAIINGAYINDITICYENQMITQSEEKVWTQTTLTPIFDSEKKLVKLIIVDADISQLKDAEERIIQQKKEIEIQRDQIAVINTDMTASIQYAKRIQKVILPSDEIIKQNLPECFVLFKPKDIVSGDFYWVEHKFDKTYFATVDCTGHGVPGAFMSIIGNNILNKALHEYNLQKPSEILNFLNKEILIHLTKKDNNSNVQDGMDLTLCSLNREALTLDFAGVHSRLYLIRNNDLKVFKTNSHAIGVPFTKDFKSYGETHIQLEKGDVFYVFTDGFVDQIGGPKKKKFLSKNFREFLFKIHSLSLSTQKQKLDAVFSDWKGSLDQVDDVLLIGIKV